MQRHKKKYYIVLVAWEPMDSEFYGVPVQWHTSEPSDGDLHWAILPYLYMISFEQRP